MTFRKKQRKKESPIAEMNVVPYIDVMLVLLVIFMITAPMLTQGITVDLPKTASTAVESSDREPIIVSVNNVGDYFLNISDNPETPMNLDDISVRVAAELTLASNEHQKINVLVKGDKGVPYGKVVLAMGSLKAAGADKVGLLTDSSSTTESTS
jgi:biopolymer transport protein TolR